MFGSLKNDILGAAACKLPEEIKVNVVCSIWELFHGTIKTISYQQESPNPNNLIVSKEVHKSIIISPGASETHKMIFKGEGNISLDNIRSDLIVSIHVKHDH